MQEMTYGVQPATHSPLFTRSICFRGAPMWAVWALLLWWGMTTLGMLVGMAGPGTGWLPSSAQCRGCQWLGPGSDMAGCLSWGVPALEPATLSMFYFMVTYFKWNTSYLRNRLYTFICFQPQDSSYTQYIFSKQLFGCLIDILSKVVVFLINPDELSN